MYVQERFIACYIFFLTNTTFIRTTLEVEAIFVLCDVGKQQGKHP